MKTVAKGRRSELLMMSVLLESGFNVFEELADGEGIDCGVLGSNKIFYPIQIKSRVYFTAGKFNLWYGAPARWIFFANSEKHCIQSRIP